MSAREPGNGAEPNYLPLRELGRRLRDGELSPLALTERCLQLLETHGARFNAVVTLTGERAHAQARRAEVDLKAGRVRGPLHGIPYGAKDLLATSGGIPTTWGFAPLREQVFDEDAAVIKRLDAAGAILVAKLAMVELAGGMLYDQPNATFTGPGINPWNTEAWTGGSSSGSGAAVALGLVPFAIGTETNGSITGPSAMCGLTGLRPGFGLVSRRGAMALSWTLDKIGPICHGAEDCGLVLEAIAGAHAGDDTSETRPFRYQPAAPERGKWRLCVLRGEKGTPQPAVAENLRIALEVLEAVAEFEERELPPHPYHEAALTVMCAEAGAAFAHLAENGWAERLTAPESRAV
ncbi:MAG: amidase, partial [bacterium]